MPVRTLGLYLQVPFCESKCSFCNFSSRVAAPAVFDRYAAALEREIRCLPGHLARQGVPARVLSLPVDSIYFGGGTPSLFGGRRLAGLVEALSRRFQFAPALEFTVEITPGSADDRFLAEARLRGVNRLSIGAQSFDDRELRSVGRLHSAEDTAAQAHLARRAGIAALSLDLIAGLPHQTEASWQKSLDRALELAPQHLSIYLFEADDKSRLGKEVLEGGSRYHARSVPDEEFMAAAYEEARRRLARAGYGQYEISNFALPGFESRHNLKYWQLDPYVGLGAGAHSFDGGRRWANAAAVEDYQGRLSRGDSPISEFHKLSGTEQVEEFFFLGLRRRSGIEIREARRRWGPDSLDGWQGKLDELLRQGWLEASAGRLRLADRALLVSNEIFQEFVSA